MDVEYLVSGIKFALKNERDCVTLHFSKFSETT